MGTIDSNHNVHLVTYASKTIAGSAMKRTSFGGMHQIEEFKNSPETHYQYINDPNDPNNVLCRD